MKQVTFAAALEAVDITAPRYPDTWRTHSRQIYGMAWGGKVLCAEMGASALNERRVTLSFDRLTEAAWNQLRTFLLDHQDEEFTYTDSWGTDFTARYIEGIETARTTKNHWAVDLTLDLRA